MKHTTDVVIIGGGLAGLTSGIHLSKKGISVTIIEKSDYPKHKVCGEYVSSEILPYLTWLGTNLAATNAVKINRFSFSAISGKMHTSQLPLGGIGISRYKLDHLLYNRAMECGCTVVHDTVTGLAYNEGIFTIKTASATYTAAIVLGAYGKRSGLDQVLYRKFITQKSPWLAVKAHYKGNFPDDLVSLYNFPGGYCGVSKVEDDALNICYLADYKTFKRYKNIEEYQHKVLYKNPGLKALLNNSRMIFDKPLTISQISFASKKPVEDHILMIGDTAGLIHPLCGNGMAMAIHSAKIAVELVLDFFAGNLSRPELETRYTKAWNHHFSNRIKTGRLLAGVLQNKICTTLVFSVISMFPNLLPLIIKRTHGKPIPVAS